MKISIILEVRKIYEYSSSSQELTITQDYLVFNLFYLFAFTLERMEFFIIRENYIEQKYLM